MKISNLEFREYAAQKPLNIMPDGRFIAAQDIAADAALSLGSLYTLDTAQQIQLTVERYALEPDFTMGVIGAGLYTRDEVIAEVKAQTPLGQDVVRAEMQYCNELSDALARPKPVAKWPVLPDAIAPVWPEHKRIKRCFYFRLSNRALFCENTTDSITTPFANYRIAHVHPVFRARGFNVVVLSGVNDVRLNFVPEATRAHTVYLSGIGHGSYTAYTGHMHNHILDACHYDPAEVKGKSIHFLSCKTATTLGPDTVAKGACSYAGYYENFNLVWDDPRTPGVDEFELFARSDSVYDIAMACGATAQQAYDHTIAAFNAAIGMVPGTAAAALLLWDRDHLRLIGDPECKIHPYCWIKICFPLVAAREELLIKAGVLEG